MVDVTQTTANWRLFGGGGLLVAAVLWILAIVLGQTGVGIYADWLVAIALLVLVVAHLFLAFGQTGSNGIVGALGWGKIALLVAGTGWFIWAIVTILVALRGFGSETLTWVASVLVVVGGLVSVVAIYGRGVAQGIARWALVLPVLWTIFLFLVTLLPITLDSPWWVALVLAVLYGLTGVAYLFNRVDLPSTRG